MNQPTYFVRRTSITLLFTCGLGACDAAGAIPDSGQSVDASSPHDSGSTATDAGTHDAGELLDAFDGEMTYSLAVGDCFTFETGTSAHSGGLACGDLMALSGSRVDLTSPGAGGICDLTGTFTSLDAVPTDYTSCVWSMYLEGGSALIDHGIIVRDAAQTHHYQVRIRSNAQPALQFEFAAID